MEMIKGNDAIKVVKELRNILQEKSSFGILAQAKFCFDYIRDNYDLTPIALPQQEAVECKHEYDSPNSQMKCTKCGHFWGKVYPPVSPLPEKFSEYEINYAGRHNYGKALLSIHESTLLKLAQSVLTANELPSDKHCSDDVNYKDGECPYCEAENKILRIARPVVERLKMERDYEQDMRLRAEETIKELQSRLKDGEGNSKKCKRCGYEGQDTTKYDGLCYQCYADKNNIQ
jgi:hypothetical protein